MFASLPGCLGGGDGWPSSRCGFERLGGEPSPAAAVFGDTFAATLVHRQLPWSRRALAPFLFPFSAQLSSATGSALISLQLLRTYHELNTRSESEDLRSVIPSRADGEGPRIAPGSHMIACVIESDSVRSLGALRRLGMTAKEHEAMLNKYSQCTDRTFSLRESVDEGS